MNVRKAVIPTAGFGTRFLPATKSMPKGMITVVDRPIIHYIVESAVQSGIEEIVLVTSSSSKPLEDYFDRNFELETTLARTKKLELLEEVRAITRMADIAYVRQKEPLGNGHAVLVAKHVIGEAPFLVLWGDDILIGDPPVPGQLIDVAERYDGPVVGVRRVTPESFEKYGMLQIEELPKVSGRGRPGELVTRAVSVVEKPRRTESPSDLAQIGGFVLTPDIFELLASAEAGPTGEIYLADALVRLMAERTVYAYEFTGTRYDVGDKLDYLRATVELALKHPKLGSAFRQYLHTVDLDR